MYIGLVLLLVLHSAGGIEISIAPGQITSLRDAPRERAGHYPPEASCLINLTDGKSIAVIETCEFIRGQIGEGKHP